MDPACRQVSDELGSQSEGIRAHLLRYGLTGPGARIRDPSCHAMQGDFISRQDQELPA